MDVLATRGQWKDNNINMLLPNKVVSCNIHKLVKIEH